MSAYKESYSNEVIPAMQQRFNYRNIMEVPKISKVCINMGVGVATQNQTLLDNAVEELTLIAGQKAVTTRARKSVAAFNVREGNEIGCRVTLRRDRMYEFLNKLLHIVLPQIRDFRGTNLNSFDGRGNYSLGLQEQDIFPEIDYDKVSEVRGMNINITTTAKTDEEARELLQLMGMPFGD